MYKKYRIIIWGAGRQLLDKSAENLLKWQDIDINYCFSWANESWVCSWSAISGNAWTTTEKKNGSGILIRQTYGDKSEWKKHFEYLLPFFQDERYIKKENRPVFIIYKPKAIKQIKEMIQYWNRLAVEQGFSGIYFIGTNELSWEEKEMNAGMLYEPDFSTMGKYDIGIGKIKKLLEKININIPRIYHYDRIWKQILNRKNRKGIYLGGFVDFDRSPRRGTDGDVMQGMSPSKFGKYFGRLYQKAFDREDEYIFLTAWNEWGESAYLEPDSRYGTKCLQEIRKITKGCRKN